MIDTIKFRIPSDRALLDFMYANGTLLKKVDKSLNLESDYKCYFSIPVGEYGYEFQLYASGAPFGSESVYLEFSMPKILFGHNVALIREFEIQKCVAIVFASLRKLYPDIAPYSEWEVQRLDLCYIWVFPDLSSLITAINYTKFLTYPRKNTHFYKTTSMYSGRSFTLRFYLKEPEYRKGDYKRLKIYKEKYANFVLDKSTYVLRFEAELRKSELKRAYKKSVVYSDLLNFSQFYELLELYLSKFRLVDYIPLKRLKMSYFIKNFSLSKKIQGYEPFA